MVGAAVVGAAVVGAAVVGPAVVGAVEISNFSFTMQFHIVLFV